MIAKSISGYNECYLCGYEMQWEVFSFEQFYLEYNRPIISKLGKEKKWIVEKIATEAIFEYIRQKQYFYKPSRLSSTYFTNSLDAAEKFNNVNREGEADIFTFNADKNNAFCFNMDIFKNACVSFETRGLTLDTFLYAKHLAEIYWKGYEGINNDNCEILYLGMPILKNIKYEKDFR